jgi:urease accessory protein
VVGGDQLELNVTMDAQSHAVITTPSAGKFYRSAGPQAAQKNRLVVGNQASLEWMPQETIMYNLANAKMHTMIRLEPGAQFIGWEMVCLGLPASGRAFSRGQLDQRLEIRRAGHTLLLETLRVQDRDPILTDRWGLNGCPVIGTMVATTGDNELLQPVRKKTAGIQSSGLFSVTRMNGLTVCRYLGDDVYAGFKYFLGAWEVLRPAVMGKTMCVPRIWAT